MALFLARINRDIVTLFIITEYWIWYLLGGPVSALVPKKT